MRRCTRMSARQEHGLGLMEQYGLSLDSMPWDFSNIFQRDVVLVLEVGFGMGQTLFECARQHPDKNFLGMEVHKPGIGSLLAEVAEAGLKNVRVYDGDAVEAIKSAIPDKSLDEVYLFFPDPWPKRAHHKRRIIQPEFVSQLAQKLKAGGLFHMATDWEDYALHMMRVMSASAEFENKFGEKNFAPDPGERGLTKFEKRGMKLGHGVWDLVFTKTS